MSEKNFLAAIDAIADEKGLSKEQIIAGIEESMTIVFRKTYNTENIKLKIDFNNFKVEAKGSKIAREFIEDDMLEMDLEEAKRYKPDAKDGDEITFKINNDLENFDRTVLVSAKQVLRQKIREAEYEKMISEYGDKENDIVVAKIEDVKDGNIYLNLNKTIAVLPRKEQIPGESFAPDQKIQVVIKSIASQSKRGPKVTVSRRDPGLVKLLFEQYIPEVASGAIEVAEIVRYAGEVAKVAIISHDDNLDAIGTAVGVNSERVNEISKHINGEKIEIIEWEANPDNDEYIKNINIANSLSPAIVTAVKILEDESKALVIVPDNQLSVAIGLGGRNVKMASKLLNMQIDVKSESDAEAEKIEYEPNI